MSCQNIGIRSKLKGVKDKSCSSLTYQLTSFLKLMISRKLYHMGI